MADVIQVEGDFEFLVESGDNTLFAKTYTMDQLETEYHLTVLAATKVIFFYTPPLLADVKLVVRCKKKGPVFPLVPGKIHQSDDSPDDMVDFALANQLTIRPTDTGDYITTKVRAGSVPSITFIALRPPPPREE